MGLGRLYYKIINRKYYKDIPVGLLLMNWIFQRVFRINGKFKYSVHFTSRVNGAKNLILKGNSPKVSIAISGGCYFSCHSAKIEVGENTIFANNVTIVSANHDKKDRSKYVAKPVVIGKNCWIGAGAVILPGVEIADGITIGSNSVVNKSFKERGVVIAGNPARII